MFVDQKWINLAPCFFENVKILKQPGCNMAFWNLHERHLSSEGGVQCVSKRLLRPAWCPKVARWFLDQSVRKAGCGPAFPGVWERRRRLSPLARLSPPQTSCVIFLIYSLVS